MTTFSPTSTLYDALPSRRRHDNTNNNAGTSDAALQQLPAAGHKPWVAGPEDSLSDVSTSDSGRGGSDVELASQAASRNSADGSFSSGRPFLHHHHNNLSVGRRQQDNPSSSVAATTHVNIPVESAVGQRGNAGGSSGRGYRSVHFQAPPPALATFQPRASATPSPSPSHDDASSIYVKLANHRQQQTLHNPVSSSSSSGAGGYLEMRPRPAWGAPPAALGPAPQLDVTAELDEGAGGGDDTTTSGSYTVDASELCHEIDQLFFQGPPSKDVVV